MTAYATLYVDPCRNGDCYKTECTPPGKQPLLRELTREQIDFRLAMECGDGVSGFQLQFHCHSGSPALAELRKRLASLIDQIDRSGSTAATLPSRFTLELGGLLPRS